MENSLCGKVIHFSEEGAEPHQKSLADRYGKEPNIYECPACSNVMGSSIYHVGYGYDQKGLSKKARRARKHAKRNKK